MDSTKADRLRHVAEVAGWMADGKAIQWQDSRGKWNDQRLWIDAIAERITQCGEKYRVKPEPVEVSTKVVLHAGHICAFLPFIRFNKGDRVRVTKLED